MKFPVNFHCSTSDSQLSFIRRGISQNNFFERQNGDLSSRSFLIFKRKWRTKLVPGTKTKFRTFGIIFVASVPKNKRTADWNALEVSKSLILYFSDTV